MSDWTYLRAFCGGDTGRMKKYMALFLKLMPPALEELKQARNAADGDRIATVLHGNKSMLLMMGMQEVYDRSGELEARCREATPEDLPQAALSALSAELEKALDEVRSGHDQILP